MRRSASTSSSGRAPFIDRAAFAAVGAFVLVITWNGLRTPVGAAGSLVLIIAFAAFLARAVLLRRPVLIPPLLLAGAAGFALAAMLNVIVQPDPSLIDKGLLQTRTTPGIAGLQESVVPRSDISSLAKFEVALLLVPVMIASVATTRWRVERLIDVFVLSATVNAAVGVVDLAGFHIAPLAAPHGRTAGLTIHPNYLGLVCTVAIPLALYWITRGGRWRAAGLISTAFLLLGTYGSGSRVSAVTALLGVVVTVILIPGLRPGLGVVVPAVGILILGLFLVAGDQILQQIRISGNLSTSVNTATSDSTRTNLANLALTQFEARPLQGVGPSVLTQAHSIYLQLLAAGGVIAMTSFVVYIAGIWGAARRAMSGAQHDAAVAGAISIAMWLTSGIFNNQLADKYLYVIPGVLVAMAYVASTSKQVAKHPAPSATGPSGRATPSLVAT
jgi:O-antigen ligase